MGIKLFTGVWHKLWWPTGHLHLHHSATVWSLGSGVCVGDGTSTSPRRPHSFIFQHTHLCLRVMTARRQQSPLEFLLAGGTFSICVNMQFYCLRKPVLSLAAHKHLLRDDRIILASNKWKHLLPPLRAATLSLRPGDPRSSFMVKDQILKETNKKENDCCSRTWERSLLWSGPWPLTPKRRPR